LRLSFHFDDRLSNGKRVCLLARDAPRFAFFPLKFKHGPGNHFGQLLPVMFQAQCLLRGEHRRWQK
jgi:hypothetical protein